MSETAASAASDDLKTAVILLQYGGPDSPEAVQPFLFNLFNDPYIIEAPSPVRWLIAQYASRKRAPVAREIYAEMGGASPIRSNTEKQVTALDEMLNSSQMGLGTVKTFMAMRYWHPLTDETAKAVKAWNPDRLLLLPLYPQYSRATTGSSIRVWEMAAKRVGLDVPTHAICCYPEDPGFIDAMARLVKKGIADARAQSGGKTPHVIFSAHGLPERNIRKGDPYQMQVGRSVEACIRRLEEMSVIPSSGSADFSTQSAGGRGATRDRTDYNYTLAFQSRVGPLKWITPDTEEVIKERSAAGDALVIVPVAFVSEHSETLVELDIEYKEIADEAGAAAYVRVPTVDQRASFIDGLAAQVQKKLGDTPGVCSSDGGRYCSGDWARCGCKV